MAAWGLLGAAAVAAAMPWQQWAEASAANLMLALCSLCLPVACLWQGLRAARQRRLGGAWRLEALAACSLCGLCALLAAFGLWPLAPWRW